MAQFIYTMNRVGKVVPPKRVILRDISLSFFPGAKIGVLGLNGSGKSTLLRIMAGIDKEFEGDLWTDADVLKFLEAARSHILAAAVVTISLSFGYSGAEEDTRHLAQLVVPRILELRGLIAD